MIRMSLDEYLEASGESDDEFATRAGIGRSTIWRIRNNGARSAAVIEKVTKATKGKVTALDLLAKKHAA